MLKLMSQREIRPIFDKIGSSENFLWASGVGKLSDGNIEESKSIWSLIISILLDGKTDEQDFHQDYEKVRKILVNSLDLLPRLQLHQ